MLRGVLVDETPVARDVRQEHPPRAAAERVAHRPEFRAPAIERAEVTRQDVGHALRRLAVSAHAREVQLVQQRGIERDQLLALEAVEDVRRRFVEIERFELLRDRVQAPERTAVVVLVVALDERQREPVQRPGTAVDLLQLVTHRHVSIPF
jgi:hypothetical protein